MSQEREGTALTENGYDVFNSIDEVNNGLSDGSSRNQRSLVERYIDGHMKLGILLINTRPADYGVIREVGQRVGERHVSTKDDKFCGGDPNSYQPPMFSQNVQLVECEQGVIPSAVRLQRLEPVGGIGRKGLYEFVPLIIPTRKGVSVPCDWKINIIVPEYHFALSDRDGEKVKGAAKTIYDRPDISIDDGWQRIIDAKLEELFSCLNVRLCEQSIRSTFLPGSEALLENWQLGYGPIDTGFRL